MQLHLLLAAQDHLKGGLEEATGPQLKHGRNVRPGAWVEYLRTALLDLANVTTVEREEDRHRDLVLEYDGGLRVPLWMASDGTLRLLALTVPAYIPDFSR